MQYLSVEQVIELHRRVVQQSGGSLGIRDRGAGRREEAVVLAVARGELSRERFGEWLGQHVVPVV